MSSQALRFSNQLNLNHVMIFKKHVSGGVTIESRGA